MILVFLITTRSLEDLSSARKTSPKPLVVEWKRSELPFSEFVFEFE